MIVTLLDTSIASDNAGDEIIMDAVETIVHSLFPDAYFYKVATHEYMTSISRKIVAKSDVALVGGTNILSSRMVLGGAQWKLSPWDGLRFQNAILLGVGWRNYQRRPDPYTRWLIRRVVASDAIHSVRDSHTKGMLADIDRKVYNTSCPTTWELTPEHCALIPTTKSDSVVTAVTGYRSNPDQDREIFALLRRAYRTVYFWAQQEEDIGYFESLGVNGIERLAPNLGAYNEFLRDESADYVGSRLHGGIRAIQRGKRAAILAVDNRAAEIANDTGLTVFSRDGLAELEAWIWGDSPTRISLPTDAIASWKAQFAS